MKRVIKAASERDKLIASAEKIFKTAQQLLDLMDDADEAFLENNDLMPLYEELIETLPALSMAIKSDSLSL